MVELGEATRGLEDNCDPSLVVMGPDTGTSPRARPGLRDV